MILWETRMSGPKWQKFTQLFEELPDKPYCGWGRWAVWSVSCFPKDLRCTAGRVVGQSGGNGPKEELTNQAQEEIGEVLPDVFAVMEPSEPGTFHVFELGDVKVLGTCTHGRCYGTDGVGGCWFSLNMWLRSRQIPLHCCIHASTENWRRDHFARWGVIIAFPFKTRLFHCNQLLCAPGVARQCSHTMLVFPKLSAQAPFFTSKACSHVNFPRVNPWKFQLCAAWTTVADFTVSAELHE